jgi:hypothetical protein
VGQKCIRGRCEWYCETESDRRRTHIYDPATQCCTGYGIEQKYPIQNYTRCEKTRVPRPGYTPDVNGCGAKNGPKVPDHFKKASFLAACNAHDRCYGTCRAEKSACDDAFVAGITKACRDAFKKGSKNRRDCMETVKTYELGVRLGGTLVGAYDDAQSEACQCCP